MRIRISSGIYQILLLSVILVYSTEGASIRIKYFRLYKNYFHKRAIYNSLKLNFQKSLKSTTEIAVSSDSYQDMAKPLIHIYKLPLSEFALQYTLNGKKNKSKSWSFSWTNSSNSSFENHLSFSKNNSERSIKLGRNRSRDADEEGRQPPLNRKKRENKAIAQSETGQANAGSLTYDKSDAISTAMTEDGVALARSYAKGQGISNASAGATETGDATAISKADQNNSTASAMSQDGGEAWAASDAGGDGFAAALAQSSGGTSTAVIQVENGGGTATAVHMSNDDKPGNNDADDNDDSEEKPKMRMMGRTMGGEFDDELDENSPKVRMMGRTMGGDFEDEQEDKIFEDKFLTTGQLKKPKKRKRKEGRKREKKFKFARFILR